MIRCWNQVTLIGNVGADPFSKTDPNEASYCRVNIATSSTYKDKLGKDVESTEWHKLVAFGKMAEYLTKFAFKGARLAVKGRIHYNKFKDKSGVEKEETQIIVEDFLSMSKQDNSGGETITIHKEEVVYFNEDQDIPF